MSLEDPRPPPELLTIRQTMTRLGVSRRTVYNWLARQIIEVVYTVSGQPRIVAASLATRATKHAP